MTDLEQRAREILKYLPPQSSTPFDISAYAAKLAAYVEQEIKKVRIEAIGWMYAKACSALDAGKDLRQIEVPEIIERASKDLERILQIESEGDHDRQN